LPCAIISLLLKKKWKIKFKDGTNIGYLNFTIYAILLFLELLIGAGTWFVWFTGGKFYWFIF